MNIKKIEFRTHCNYRNQIVRLKLHFCSFQSDKNFKFYTLFKFAVLHRMPAILLLISFFVIIPRGKKVT